MDLETEFDLAEERTERILNFTGNDLGHKFRECARWMSPIQVSVFIEIMGDWVWNVMRGGFFAVCRGKLFLRITWEMHGWDLKKGGGGQLWSGAVGVCAMRR